MLVLLVLLALGAGVGAAAGGAGEPCGVYTAGCARGLRCVPRPGERAPLRALLRGEGACRAVGGRRAARNRTEPAGESQREGHRPAQPTTEPQPPEAEGSKARVQQVSLSSEAKEAFETAPCRVHLAAVMQELKASLYLSGEDLFIPNCDTRGFYRRKQCRASKGPKRGQCWCVDKKGHPLAGMEGAEGVPHCLPPSGD